MRKNRQIIGPWRLAPQPAVSPTICLLSHAERGSEAQGKTQSKKMTETQTDNLPSATQE